ncbi:MAG: GNAT family N-acetyltransferase [Phycisphaerales bacterium JB040]
MHALLLNPDLLADQRVRLTPLEPGHASDLLGAGDEETFRYMPTRPETQDEPGVRAYVERLRTSPATLPFAVLDAPSGRAIGVTSYLEIRPDHRGLEIGHTWIGPAFRATPVNPAMKRLLLRHAFEHELFPGGPAIRVQLKTDDRNERSKRAILKLGAKFEGVLWNHLIMPDGHYRATAMYCITNEDWPTVCAALNERLT